MGAGIAEVFARSGYDVVGLERQRGSVERGREHVEGSTGRAVKRGKLTEDERGEIIARIRFTTDYADLADADLVVEAVPE